MRKEDGLFVAGSWLLAGREAGKVSSAISDAGSASLGLCDISVVTVASGDLRSPSEGSSGVVFDVTTPSGTAASGMD